MGAYIERLLGCDPVEARRVQKAHFHEHGTTLAGLMKHHDVDPHHFLADVHDIDARPDRRRTRGWTRGLGRLPGRKFVFTNGDAPYARRVLDRARRRRTISTSSTTSTPPSFAPSPTRTAIACCVDRFAIDPARTRDGRGHGAESAPAKTLGMTTVWVDNGSERGNHGHDPASSTITIADVGEWLDEFLRGPA